MRRHKPCYVTEMKIQKTFIGQPFFMLKPKNPKKQPKSRVKKPKQDQNKKLSYLPTWAWSTDFHLNLQLDLSSHYFDFEKIIFIFFLSMPFLETLIDKLWGCITSMVQQSARYDVIETAKSVFFLYFARM